jgi:hypothetical protein
MKVKVVKRLFLANHTYFPGEILHCLNVELIMPGADTFTFKKGLRGGYLEMIEDSSESELYPIY